MGTRSVTRIYNDNAKQECLVSIYRQFDGYILGHGYELKNLLSNKRLVNGFQNNMTTEIYFNGMGCMAAWLIGKLKGDAIGHIYITYPDDEQEYLYELYPDGLGRFKLTVTSYNEVLFDDYIEYLKEE